MYLEKNENGIQLNDLYSCLWAALLCPGSLCRETEEAETCDIPEHLC